jgi:hypothetical protein
MPESNKKPQSSDDGPIGAQVNKKLSEIEKDFQKHISFDPSAEKRIPFNS